MSENVKRTRVRIYKLQSCCNFIAEAINMQHISIALLLSLYCIFIAFNHCIFIALL